MRGLQAGILRTSDRTIEFFGQYNVLNQRSGAAVGLGVLASVDGTNNFRDSYSPAIGVALSRELGDHGAVYVEPIWVHNSNLIDLPGEDNSTFLVGLGARVRVGPTVYLTGEFSPRAGYPPARIRGRSRIEKRAGGHVFQLNVSNGFGNTMGQMARGGTVERRLVLWASTFQGNSSDELCIESSSTPRVVIAPGPLGFAACGGGGSPRRRRGRQRRHRSPRRSRSTPRGTSRRRTSPLPAGSRVTFTNNHNVDHQMESDPHPEHTLCPSLKPSASQPRPEPDQQQPEHAVVCTYHDHINDTNANLKGRFAFNRRHDSGLPPQGGSYSRGLSWLQLEHLDAARNQLS